MALLVVSVPHWLAPPLQETKPEPVDGSFVHCEPSNLLIKVFVGSQQKLVACTSSETTFEAVPAFLSSCQYSTQLT
ncbi:MAG: hypothetical protein V9F46_01380 [Chitinophagaceae bacterium]